MISALGIAVLVSCLALYFLRSVAQNNSHSGNKYFKGGRWDKKRKY